MDPTISSPVPTEDNMGMAYIPVYAEEPAGSSSGTGEILFYRNPMDPTITSPVPAEDDMGMAYIPVYADAGGESSADGPVVRIDAATVQNMNVQFERAERNDITHHIRTVGYFEYDQERMVSITTKYSGWIEKVHVNYVGEKVSQGQPLFEIYSPELVQTEQELLSALGYARQMAGTPEDVRVRAENLVAAARTRLSYWDITPEQIERLEQEGRVVRTLTVTAPSSGVVMMRMPGLEGMSVKPGMELFHIAGVQSLWLNVEVFEGQLAFVDVGSRADVSLSYFPGTDFSGVVRFIAPEVSEKTRSISLLLEVPNANGKLKAGMFATVLFEPVIRRQAVTVPRLAVIRTGERDVVILQREPGRFVPRVVRVGHEGLISTEILEGVEEGDLVVTSGQFLIDSESSLQAAIQKMIEARNLEATQSKAAPSAEESDASAHEGAGHAQ
jgi:Cu(I)/Ag(I) efflux system membrane fusion protein